MKKLACLAACLAALILGGCDAGNGTSTDLPPGEPTTAPPGDLVLFVSESEGDRVVAYRLGTDGFLPREPYDSVSLDNPRTMLLRDDVLYVAMEDRVVALSIGPDGSLPSLPSSQTNPQFDAEATDLLLIDDVLYVSFEDIGRVRAYRLDSGQLPPDPISSSGTSISDYRTLASADGFLYAGSLDGTQIDTYIIQADGSLTAEPEPQEPDTEIFRPEDMFVANGMLYSICQSHERIEAFELRSNGHPVDEWTTRTAGEQRYARLLLDGDRLYASGFSKGRIDMYVLEPDGSLPRDDPFAKTAPDAALFPIEMVLNDGILYVVQSGPGRIDAYVLGGDGAPARYPASSTDAITRSTPLGMVLGTYPE